MARSFRSPVWSFIDQPQPSTDGQSETVCKLCKKTFAYHGGTWNLQAHLERKHPHSFKVKSDLQGSVEKSATRQKAQPLITQHAIAKPSATACSEPRKNAINDLITDWLVADLRPLSIVTGEGFFAPVFLLGARLHRTMSHFFYFENTAATQGGESVCEERVSRRRPVASVFQPTYGQVVRLKLTTRRRCAFY